jgi:phospholipid/cholesterol/gamma-HCH transport system substrate-binding protein
MAFARTRRRRTDVAPVRPTVVRGLMAFGLVGAFVYIGVMAFNGVPLRDYKYVYVSVPDVGNLLRHDPVRIGGVQVGQVASSTLGADGRPRIRLQINPGTKLPADTAVKIRANGLLGARYVELRPGASAQEIAAGATIHGDANALTYGVPQALDTLDARTRAGLTKLTNGLGQGFLGRGRQLNDAVRLGPLGVVAAAHLSEVADADPTATRRLLPALRSAVVPFDASRTEYAALFAATAGATQPFIDRQDDVRATLDQAPSALAAAQVGLGDGTRLLTAVTGLAREMTAALPRAPAGLRGATTLLQTAPPSLRKAGALLDAAEPAVPAALKILNSAKPLLRPMRSGLDTLVPMLHQVAPYACDFKNWGAVMRSMDGFGGFGDGPLGPLGEFRAEAAVTSPGATFGIAGDGTGLVHRDQYPAPCTYLSKPYPAGR